MAYLRIAKDSKYSFLLESVLAGENIARYSFIGAGMSSVPPSFLFRIIRILLQLRSPENNQNWTRGGD